MCLPLPFTTEFYRGGHENDPDNDPIPVEVTQDHIDAAADEVLDDDDLLMTDLVKWLRDDDDGDLWVVELPYSTKHLHLAKLLRDNDAEFRNWREARHANRIHDLAEAKAINGYERDSGPESDEPMLPDYYDGR